MRRRLRAVAVLMLAACHRGEGSGNSAAGAAPSASADASPVAIPAIAPARCTLAPGGGLALGNGPSLEDLEIGDAVSYPGGFAVNVVHRTAAGRTAAIALLPPAANSVQLVDLATTLGDAPPPQVVASASNLVAAAYTVPKHAGTRELSVYLLSGASEAKLTAALPQQHDDSFAFDLSATLLAWDDIGAGPQPRSVVRVAELSDDGRVGPTRDVSASGSDAESPRIASIDKGHLLFWLARTPEAPPGLADGAPAAEVTGQARVNSWIEMVGTDAHGAPTGPVRRLTPLSGHVSAFDALPLAEPSTSRALVIARDDGEAVDGSGGVLLRIIARPDGADPPTAIGVEGLGRGSPTLVGPTPSWLSWTGPHEEARLLPLDGAGTPQARPSGEPELDEARPLALVGRDGRILAAAPADPSAQLRVVSCAP
jgi:hypothetical protein